MRRADEISKAIASVPWAETGAPLLRSRARSASGWLIGAGCAVAVASWAGLLWSVFASDPLGGTTAVARHHLVTLAQCALLTALAAILAGTIWRGFLSLAAGGRTGPAPRSVATVEVDPDPVPDMAGRSVMRNGELGGRPYVLFRDGTVDLETVFGVRSFASLDEARDFVGED